MNWEERFREGEQLVSDRRISEALEHYKAIIEETREDDKKICFWAMKHLGDVLGYAGGRDYMQSIEIYQKIINEFEEADDTLYNWCQVDIARAYLEAGLAMIENFDSMMGIMEIEDKKMVEYIQKLVNKRNEYIEREAEIIYKERM